MVIIIMILMSFTVEKNRNRFLNLLPHSSSRICDERKEEKVFSMIDSISSQTNTNNTKTKQKNNHKKTVLG